MKYLVNFKKNGVVVKSVVMWGAAWLEAAHKTAEKIDATIDFKVYSS